MITSEYVTIGRRDEPGQRKSSASLQPGIVPGCTNGTLTDMDCLAAADELVRNMYKRSEQDCQHPMNRQVTPK